MIINILSCHTLSVRRRRKTKINIERKTICSCLFDLNFSFASLRSVRRFLRLNWPFSKLFMNAMDVILSVSAVCYFTQSATTQSNFPKHVLHNIKLKQSLVKEWKKLRTKTIEMTRNSLSKVSITQTTHWIYWLTIVNSTFPCYPRDKILCHQFYSVRCFNRKNIMQWNQGEKRKMFAAFPKKVKILVLT